MTQKFDGAKFANQIKTKLKPKVDALIKQGRQPSIVSFVFREDLTGQLYTRLKQEMAQEFGILYKPLLFSFANYDLIKEEIKVFNQNPKVTGIMIQKPTRSLWLEHHQGAQSYVDDLTDTVNQQAQFRQWWHGLVALIKLEKDVDGLNPATLASIKQGDWQERGLVVPATAEAVFKIIQIQVPNWQDLKIAIIGKSDLVGRPLYYLLKHHLVEEKWTTSISCRLEEDEESIVLLGKKELAQLRGKGLKEFDLIVSATGRANLIDASMVKPGTYLIDVGEPNGDINSDTYKKAKFYTPVPGGVGPVTVVSLMENTTKLSL